jgi:acyl-CoA oxidase
MRNSFLTLPVSRNLPRRAAGSKPVDHSITYFNHVCLPRAALLGNLDKPTDLRQNFLSVNWRVGVGSLILSTVSIPVTLAQVFVLEAFAKDAAERFVARGLDPRIRYGIAAVFKAVMVHHVQSSLFALAERCGTQGLFEENQIIASQVRTESDMA